ncbi:MAG: L-2-hydroxyglutarate oxidase, partial [Thermoanaerobaculia bacterium]
MTSPGIQVVIVGGGIVGLATARALAPALGERLTVIEAEDRPAGHQTGNNSGVIHSGLYYRPGSVKAETCAAGREELYRFCERHAIPHQRCGKLVVATREQELPALAELERRGRANGLIGLRRLTAEELSEVEPAAAGVAGLQVRETGIVDYGAVAAKLVERLAARGVTLRTGWRLTAVDRGPGEQRLQTTGGELTCRLLVNCAGLQCDRVTRLCGHRPQARIVPFRGEYLRLVDEQARRVRGLIYPVPDPELPFLGVHISRHIDGSVDAGPNAVLALARHGYSWGRISPRDTLETLTYPGFWRLAARWWRTGVAEAWRSLNRKATARELSRLMPGLGKNDLLPAGAGVRAQAVAPDGQLL